MENIVNSLLQRVSVGGIASMCMVLFAVSTACAITRDSWRSEVYRKTLRNDLLEAKFQAGFLYELRDLTYGGRLVSISPDELAAVLPVFGEHEVNLDECKVIQEATRNSIVTTVTAPDGALWRLCWSLDEAGDLILNTSAKTPKPVDQMRMIFGGCDIKEHTMVTICVYGVARPYRAPWRDTFGNVSRTDYTRSMNHPLVVLFEGDEKGGWFVEGRDPKIGPANLGAYGRGSTAELLFVRGFPLKPTTSPEMYEIRIRTYREQWADAVYPYIEWMEKGAGFVPLDRDGHHPSWVKDIQVQSYVRVGDFEGLDELAERLDPGKVLVGRQVGFRKYQMDYHYPNYEVSESARKWIRHARDLGFHVGAHFNISGIGKTQPELVKRFRDGLLVTGVDENGDEIYYGIPGPTRHYYCSPALKAWREYLIAQMREAVDAGIDVIYLDESMAPNGSYVVDGMTGVQGTFAMMEEVKEAYPGVAIETEQFNTLTAYRSDFALSQMPLGHPLSGYIFSRFIKIVPEGVMGTPTDKEYAEAFYHWGYMVPSAHVGVRESWFEIAGAYQKYGLVPDCRRTHDRPISYVDHYTHGVILIYDDREDIRYFGLRGDQGVTACFEKHGHTRGMMLYRPGKEPRWFGARVTGVTEWPGPGAIKDWLIYSGNRLMALDPARSYSFDESAVPPADRFHITDVPDDFVLHYIAYLDDSMACYEGQEIGREDACFKVRFNGNGRLGMYVPDEYLIFINGQPISVDGSTKTASAVVNTGEVLHERETKMESELVEGVDQMVTAAAFREVNELGEEVAYSMLVAFRKEDVELLGKWADLPWQVPPKQRSWHILQHELYEATADGPALMLRKGKGFFNHVTGRGILIGRFPEADVIRMEGGYRIREESMSGNIEGKVWINGKQVLALPGSDTLPFELQTFNVDISEYAGQYAMVEFGVEGEIRGNVADWISPQFIANPNSLF